MMKVVLFCGGLGTRLREYSDTIPKPMVEIGYRPIIWHLMKYYAHFGHCDFILCLGYRGDYIKRYFLNYDECLSNDFVMSESGRAVCLFNSDISNWRITFVDTGLHMNIGQRLKAVQPYLDGEEVFMANYADGLSNLNLTEYVNFFHHQNQIASFLAVRPSQSFHHVQYEQSGLVTKIHPIDQGDFWINGGFFIFRQSIFEYIREGEELVVEPFQRLIAEKRLVAYQNPGFWACMDTFKEKKLFDEMYERGNPPWAVWEKQYDGAYKQLYPELTKSNGHFILLDRSNLVPHHHTGR
jgi:glucose-1-phosphate cytidylyltransferase